MKKINNRYGINMVRFIAEHESRVQAKLDVEGDRDALLAEHLVKIQWLQHERLVHLLVTMLVAVLLMFLYGLLALGVYHLLLLILLCIVAVLLAAYLFHYFRLENSVQRWYLLADRIRESKIDESQDDKNCV